MGNEPTIQDVLEAVNATSSAMEERFLSAKQDLEKSQNKLKMDIIDAMDNKLVDLKGDLVILMRKEDKKVTALIGLLTERKIISMDDAKQLLGMEPFPQISL